MKHSRKKASPYLHRVLWIGLIAMLFNLEGLLTPAKAQTLNTADIVSESLSDDFVFSEDISELTSGGDITIGAEDMLLLGSDLDTDVLEVPIAQSDIDSADDGDTEEKEGYRKNGPYLTFYGVPVQRRASAQDFLGRATFETGGGGGGAIGYRTGDFRFDAELSYFTNDFEDLFFFEDGTTIVRANQPEQSPGAFVDGRAIMINAYYDIPLSNQFRPYVGAGVGILEARIANLSPPTFGGFVANSTTPNLFAYQLRAGLTYSPDPGFDLFAGYRFFKGEQFEYPIENSAPPLVLEPNGLESSSLEAGVRIIF